MELMQQHISHPGELHLGVLRQFEKDSIGSCSARTTEKDARTDNATKAILDYAFSPSV
jgi:hypothetical protein